VLIVFFSSFGPGGPPSSKNTAIAGIASGSPSGSLRDQFLAGSEQPSDAIATIEFVAWSLYRLMSAGTSSPGRSGPWTQSWRATRLQMEQG
jgi:hypothetical protein